VEVLIDSDILIEVLRQRDETILARWRDLGQSGTPISYCPVTAAELWSGVRPSEQIRLAAFFQALRCPVVNDQIGRKAGDYLRESRKSHGVDLGDALIAATASITGAALWTRNRKHYPMKDVSFF
jgi:predicted nucleic acid-binding protein